MGVVVVKAAGSRMGGVNAGTETNFTSASEGTISYGRQASHLPLGFTFLRLGAAVGGETTSCTRVLLKILFI